jgi:choline dehydrogenase-like flavoprotein
MEEIMADNVADVLVIGAGAAGLVATKHLAENGFNVVCLEQGHKVDSGEFWGDKPEWELMAQKRWHPDPNVRDLETDYPINDSEADVPALMYSAVGGTTLLYCSHWQRLMPSDFRVKTLDGVADDWPFAYEDLEPFYEEMDVEIGASGLGGDPAYPPGKGPPLPPLPIGRIGMKAIAGMNKLGWHWWKGTSSIPSRPYAGRNACVLRGACATGCPDRAKGSFDLTHLPIALEHGARLITGARVREILINEKGLATGAVYIDRAGRERKQLANAVIVCCNGIGTPRLLLLSKSARFPNGLANSSGLVGKNLMMHPYATVTGYFDEMLDSYQGPASEILRSMQFYETDRSRGFVRGAKWQVRPFGVSGGPLGSVLFQEFGVSGGAAKPLEQKWGVALHRAMRKSLGRSFEWGIQGEDLPEEANRVELDPELTDSDGIPSPKIFYRLSENSRRLMAFHIEKAKEAMLASGAIDLSVAPLLPSGHLMGTCRMGHNPERSVVNQWGNAHDVPNLHIYDGSVFVTSSGFNPTGTIAAIALRSVKHLIAERRNQKVPT